MNHPPAQVWMAFVEVRPWNGNTMFDGAPGAYSNVVCLAGEEAECRWAIANAMTMLGLDVVELADLKVLTHPFHEAVSDDIAELAGQLSESTPVLYDTFYIYESDEDEEN